MSLRNYTSCTARDEAHNTVWNKILTNLLQCPFKSDQIKLNFEALLQFSIAHEKMSHMETVLSTTHLRRQVKAKCDVPQVAIKTYARFKMGNSPHNAMLKRTEHWSDLGAAYFVHAESFQDLFIVRSNVLWYCWRTNQKRTSHSSEIETTVQYQTLYGLVCKQKGSRRTEHNKSTLTTLVQCVGNVDSHSR